MATVPFDIIGSFSTDYDPIIDPQYLGNMYETTDASAPSGKALISTPGTKVKIYYNTLSATAEVRKLFTSGIYMYDIVANTVHKISSDLTYTTLGTIGTSTGFVDFSQNLTQIIFVDGGSGYIYNGTTLSSIVTFPTDPVSVTYLDGYFIVAQSSSNKFYISAIEDGSTWDLAKYAELTTKAQNLKAVSVLNRRIYIFSEYITEVWYSTGGTGFPFARDNNILFEYGCAATGSLVNQNGILIWLASNEVGNVSVMMTDGTNLKECTTKQMKIEFQSYETISDARAYLIDIDGHTQYVINFPTENKTWTFDLTTQKWFSQYMHDKSRYLAQCHAYFNEKHYVGNYHAPKIYELSKQYKLNDNVIIPKKRISPNVSLKNGNRMMVNALEVKFKQGVESIPINDDDFYRDDAGEIYRDDDGRPYYNDNYDEVERVAQNPVVYLSTSDNGGRTFGYSIPVPLGKSGEFKHRTIWTNLGIYDQLVVKLEMFERTGMIITEANMDIQELPR